MLWGELSQTLRRAEERDLRPDFHFLWGRAFQGEPTLDVSIEDISVGMVVSPYLAQMVILPFQSHECFRGKGIEGKKMAM